MNARSEPNFLRRGSYTEEAPAGILQLRYEGGGNPGSGGFVEALRVRDGERERWILQEFRSGSDWSGYRWHEFPSMDELLAAFCIRWPHLTALRQAEWKTVPWWDDEPNLMIGRGPTNGDSDRRHADVA